MSFEEKIRALAQEPSHAVDGLETEGATKKALVMPCIAARERDL